jgi:hypothetical protein
MNDIKLVRLSTGEELITKLKSETDESYTLSKPAILIPAGKDQLAFGQWLPYAEIEDGITISKEYVIFVVDPVDDLKNQYSTSFGSGIVVPPTGAISGAGLKLTT